MLESKYQTKLIRSLKNKYPECIILKNDSSYIQGIPDLLVLYKDKWAAIECKTSVKSKFQPNQRYWIDKMNNMSLCLVAYPDNNTKVEHELEEFFKH